MRLDAVVLVGDDEPSLGGERHDDGRPAAVTFDMHEQSGASCSKVGLEFAKRLETKGCRAISGAARRRERVRLAHTRREAVFEHCEAEQRHVKGGGHAQRDLQSGVRCRAVARAQQVDNGAARTRW